ncbi:Transcription initiation factor TFIID subunit 12 [Blyttiomyces sp. JEL0837]|nr:Transcription initiation factor TFIID subunit 12 [Blyttiomyces sp. JEL0837]
MTTLSGTHGNARSKTTATTDGSEVLINSDRLKKLLAKIDTFEKLDGDVEEILADIAQDFVTSNASFSCKLARHRGAESLTLEDVQMPLDMTWGIKLPGFGEEMAPLNVKKSSSKTHKERVSVVRSAISEARNKPIGASNPINESKIGAGFKTTTTATGTTSKIRDKESLRFSGGVGAGVLPSAKASTTKSPNTDNNMALNASAGVSLTEENLRKHTEALKAHPVSLVERILLWRQSVPDGLDEELQMADSTMDSRKIDSPRRRSHMIDGHGGSGGHGHHGGSFSSLNAHNNNHHNSQHTNHGHSNPHRSTSALSNLPSATAKLSSSSNYHHNTNGYANQSQSHGQLYVEEVPLAASRKKGIMSAGAVSGGHHSHASPEDNSNINGKHVSQQHQQLLRSLPSLNISHNGSIPHAHAPPRADYEPGSNNAVSGSGNIGGRGNSGGSINHHSNSGGGGNNDVGGRGNGGDSSVPRGRLLCCLKVEIKAGVFRMLPVHEFDSSSELAHEFCKANSLHNSVEALTNHIAVSMNTFGAKR